MSKLTSLAIGLLSTVAILPASQAMAATSNTSAAIQTPSADLHAQVIVKIGTSDYRYRGYYSSWETERRLRRLEWEREREARARWRSGYYRGSYDRDCDREYRRDNRSYRY
jgi:hypothetical protein